MNDAPFNSACCPACGSADLTCNELTAPLSVDAYWDEGGTLHIRAAEPIETLKLTCADCSGIISVHGLAQPS